MDVKYYECEYSMANTDTLFKVDVIAENENAAKRWVRQAFEKRQIDCTVLKVTEVKGMGNVRLSVPDESPDGQAKLWA